MGKAAGNSGRCCAARREREATRARERLDTAAAQCPLAPCLGRLPLQWRIAESGADIALLPRAGLSHALVTPEQEVTGACSRSARSSSAPGEIGINSDTVALAC